MEAGFCASVVGGVAVGVLALDRHPAGPNRRAPSARPVSDWLGTPTDLLVPTMSLRFPFRLAARSESCEGLPGTRPVTDNPLSFTTSTKRADWWIRHRAPDHLR
jgi:hypothetical protein